MEEGEGQRKEGRSTYGRSLCGAHNPKENLLGFLKCTLVSATYQWVVEMADRESEGDGTDLEQEFGTLGHGCNFCPCMMSWLQTSDALGYPLSRSCREYPRQLEDAKQELM